MTANEMELYVTVGKIELGFQCEKLERISLYVNVKSEFRIWSQSLTKYHMIEGLRKFYIILCKL